MVEPQQFSLPLGLDADGFLGEGDQLCCVDNSGHLIPCLFSQRCEILVHVAHDVERGLSLYGVLGFDQLLESLVIKERLGAPEIVFGFGLLAALRDQALRKSGLGRGMRNFERRLVWVVCVHHPEIELAPVVALFESALYLVTSEGVPAAPSGRVLLALASLMDHLGVMVVNQTLYLDRTRVLAFGSLLPHAEVPLYVILRVIEVAQLSKGDPLFVYYRLENGVVLLVFNEAFHHDLLAFGFLDHTSEGGRDFKVIFMPR